MSKAVFEKCALLYRQGSTTFRPNNLKLFTRFFDLESSQLLVKTLKDISVVQLVNLINFVDCNTFDAIMLSEIFDSHDFLSFQEDYFPIINEQQQQLQFDNKYLQNVNYILNQQLRDIQEQYRAAVDKTNVEQSCKLIRQLRQDIESQKIALKCDELTQKQLIRQCSELFLSQNQDLAQLIIDYISTSKIDKCPPFIAMIKLLEMEMSALKEQQLQNDNLTQLCQNLHQSETKLKQSIQTQYSQLQQSADKKYQQQIQKVDLLEQDRIQLINQTQQQSQLISSYQKRLQNTYTKINSMEVDHVTAQHKIQSLCNFIQQLQSEIQYQKCVLTINQINSPFAETVDDSLIQNEIISRVSIGIQVFTDQSTHQIETFSDSINDQDVQLINQIKQIDFEKQLLVNQLKVTADAMKHHSLIQLSSKTQIDDLKMENERLISMTQLDKHNTQQQIDVTKNQLYVSSQTISELKMQIAVQLEQLTTLNNTICKLQTENQSLKLCQDSLFQKNQSLQNDILILQHRNIDISQQLSNSKSVIDIQERCQLNMDESYTEQHELNNNKMIQISQILTEKLNQITALETTISSQESIITQLQEKVEQSENYNTLQMQQQKEQLLVSSSNYNNFQQQFTVDCSTSPVQETYLIQNDIGLLRNTSVVHISQASQSMTNQRSQHSKLSLQCSSPDDFEGKLLDLKDLSDDNRSRIQQLILLSKRISERQKTLTRTLILLNHKNNLSLNNIKPTLYRFVNFVKLLKLELQQQIITKNNQLHLQTLLIENQTSKQLNREKQRKISVMETSENDPIATLDELEMDLQTQGSKQIKQII